MQKKLFLLINIFLVVMFLASCNNTPVTPTVQAPDNSEQTTPEPTEETKLEPEVDALSLSEAEDLLNNWYEWTEISYMPDLDKKDDEGHLYAFLVDYSDSEVEWSGVSYCYAWVNPTKEIFFFEEAGYSEGSNPNSYSNIPHSIFPIPMRDGLVIPYDQFSPPDYVWGVAYTYEDKSVMESYKAQLAEVGFVDYGAVQSVESLWRYELPNDDGSFTVEMYSEGDTFSMNMYIGY